MFVLTTDVESSLASRYLQQLCKHFAHKVPATWTPEAGEVDFPFGKCRMKATEGQLSIHCETAVETNLPRLKLVLSDHFERFAWREKLRLEWEQTETT